FKWFVEDQVSIGEVVRRLRSEGVPTKTGRASWSRSTVWSVLRNPAYMGQAAFGKTEVVSRGPLLRPILGKTSFPRASKSSSRYRPRDQWISVPVPAIVSSEVFTV